jgi:hypothetical protein
LQFSEMSHRVIHVRLDTTPRMKMSRSGRDQRREIPQEPPFAKGADLRTGGFLPLIGIFIRGVEEMKRFLCILRASAFKIHIKDVHGSL